MSLEAMRLVERANYMADIIGDSNAMIVDKHGFIKFFRINGTPPKVMNMAVRRRISLKFTGRNENIPEKGPAVDMLGYQQPTPKQRILAALRDIQKGQADG